MIGLKSILVGQIACFGVNVNWLLCNRPFGCYMKSHENES